MFTKAEMMGKKASKTSLPRNLQSKAITLSIVQGNHLREVINQFKNVWETSWRKGNSRSVQCKLCYTSLISFTDLVASSEGKSKAKGVAAFICQLVYKNTLKEIVKLCLLHLYHESTTHKKCHVSIGNLHKYVDSLFSVKERWKWGYCVCGWVQMD